MSAPDDIAAGRKSRFGMLGLATVFASALVGFNTFVVSCSTDRAARDAAQLHRIEERERFWTEAMRDLGDILRARGELAGQPGAAEWEKRCTLLALRTAPFVEKARTSNLAPDGEIEMSENLLEMSGRVFELQTAFTKQMGSVEIVGPNCSKRFADERFRTVELAQSVERREEPVAGQTMEQVNQAIVARQDLIELTPPDKTGWDVDIFWCERPDRNESDQNFKDALAYGQKLADQAKSTGRLENFYLGRIRVRVLPKHLQTTKQYLETWGAQTLWWEEAQPQEGDFAAALIKGTSLRDRMRPKNSTAPTTKWYVSAFFCRTKDPKPSAPAATPASAGAVAKS